MRKSMFESRDSIMEQWDKWISYYVSGGRGSWPRDAFESLLDYLEEDKDLISRHLRTFTGDEAIYDKINNKD